MRIWLITIILGMSIFAHAQNKKNEIRIGVPFGVSFFDNSPEKIHRISTRTKNHGGISYVPIPTYFSFGRILHENLLLSFKLVYYDLNYEDYTRLNYKDEILGRHFYVFSVSLKYRVMPNNSWSSNSWYIHILSGINYRFSGGELFHVRYFDHGAWREEILDYRAYNDFGLSIGTEVQYKIYKNFSLGAEIDFTRYFSDVSPNQLSTAIFIGYEF